MTNTVKRLYNILVVSKVSFEVSFMKKRYIIIPTVCVVVLIAIIVCVALILNTGYLKKLPYDHVNSNVYNGVEIVGDDGLFYLLKDGKKVSKGYVSLQSVNDFYSKDDNSGLLGAARQGKQVTLFDYYLAKSEDSSAYILVDSTGEEVKIVGESFSLDKEKTHLPYLVFTDNSNGRKSAISLFCLDSDLSYRSGNELTLRPFKSISIEGSSEKSELCTYLVTEDITEESDESYFTEDGIKITSGEQLSRFSLYSKTDKQEHVYVYNADDKKIFSIKGELVASDVYEILRNESSEWRYALCRNEESQKSKIVIISPQRAISLFDDDYKLESMWYLDNCVVIAKNGEAESIDVINVNTSRTSNYSAAVPNVSVITATSKDGVFHYLNGDGFEILSSGYGDMVPIDGLSGKKYAVFTSAGYNEENGGAEYLHFASAGKDTYSLELTEGMNVKKLSFSIDFDVASYQIDVTADGKTVSSLLSPFSAASNQTVYNSIDTFCQNGVAWILAASYEKGAYDVIDPLSSLPVTSIKCSSEDFAKYVFEHIDNIALATNKNNSDTAVRMTVIKISKYDRDDLMTSSRYLVLSRSLPIAYSGYENAALNVTDIGTELLIDTPMTVYTDKNYLITHTASGSCVYSVDTEDYQIVEIVSLPYRITDVITDAQNTSVHYFKVKTDDGLEGIYNKEAEPILTPYYESITHADDGYFVVKLKGAWGVIRSKGSGAKTVIDFEYSEILPLGDKGYLVSNGEGKTEVYSGKKMVLAESVQSVKFIYSYTTDENGALSVSRMALISADAKLYIHRSEQVMYLTFGEYNCDGALGGVLNKTAKVIYYYQGSECIHTQVVYPTDSAPTLLGSEEGTLWYEAADAKKQHEPVTNEQIFDSNKRIIKLYSKAE